VLRRTLALAASLAIGALLLLAGSASAHGGDRNRDRIPDRWEKQHHLSLKVKQTSRDQDRDGLNNLGEWRSRTDPRDADSDNDGIGDDDENAGTVDSFTNGVLTIKLAKGGTLTGRVSEDTEIECDDGANATAAGGGDDGEQGDDDGHDQHGSGGHDENDDDGQHDDGDHGDGDHESCGTEALTAGRAVEEAELKASNGEAVYEKVELR
jgi:hypothetical protein